MRRDATVVTNARTYLSEHSAVTISIITRFEVLRGLMAKRATSQLAAFDAMCDVMDVLPLTDSIVVRAADIYGKLHRSGCLIGDADILIAATCLEYGHDLATNNVSHFSRVQGLIFQKWLLE
ncbi:MAG: type II toxin-antitoxin system VapC family toxin [Pirellulaceae bacterium]